MVAQQEYHVQQVGKLEQRVYHMEMVNASQRQLIERASEMIFKYREAIQQLVDELNRLQPQRSSRSDA